MSLKGSIQLSFSIVYTLCRVTYAFERMPFFTRRAQLDVTGVTGGGEVKMDLCCTTTGALKRYALILHNIPKLDMQPPNVASRLLK